MAHAAFIPHGYCLQWDIPLIVIYMVTDAAVALSYYSIPAALFFLAFKKRQSVPLQPLLILFGLFIAFCGGGHAIDIVSLWKPVYWLKGIWNIGTAVTSAVTAIVLLPKVLEFVRMPETTAQLAREKSQLEDWQTLVRAVLESAPNGVVVADAGGTVLHNAAAASILETPDAEIPQVVWPGHARNDQDLVRLASGRLVERTVREVPGYGEMYILRDVTEERAAEEQRLRLARIIETMTQGFAIASAAWNRIVSTNPSFDRMYGRAEGELIGSRLEDLIIAPAPAEITGRALREGFWEGEVECRGSERGSFITRARLNLHEEGDARLFSMIQVDITEEKRLEEEARRFQAKMVETAKLESVGVLAGGIAHDFNNLLTGILGNASLVYDRLSPSSPLRARVEEVVKASERAADLTRQLLAYAGKGRFVIEPVEMNSLVREIPNLVRVTIPKNVEVRIETAPGSITVAGDRGQLHQLLMNLIINGAEAIGEGRAGQVTVSTRREPLDEPAVRRLPENLSPGEYAVIELRDNGAGMSGETMAHIFEPFFTTKFTGRGLGLAAAQGIVRGHKGVLQVSSELGAGSVFRVYLPLARTAAPDTRGAAADGANLRGDGTILVIDDEEPVRNTARYTLEFYGYTVLEAENGRHAVEIFERNQEEIALVVLDLTMPVMSGEETLRRIREIRPDVPVILSSGFGESEALSRFAGEDLAGFLQKPYTSARLAEKVLAAAPRAAAMDHRII